MYPSEEADATWAKLIETSIAAISPSKISNKGQYDAIPSTYDPHVIEDDWTYRL
jgi:hypothetical protein